MVNKTSSCVFISGNGSNLKSLIKSSRDYNFPIKIELIISNNIKAGGIRLAKRYSIPYKFFPSNDQKKFERNCLFEIKKRKIKFLCLAGFMKILSSNFIRTFRHKIINIHPSLLPKYPGAHAHRDALADGAKVTGCTVHLVDEGVDSGPILAQRELEVLPDDDEDSLSERVKVLEHILYPEVIDAFAAGLL